MVLPAARDGAVRASDIRRWLAQSDLEFSDEPASMLARITRALGQPDVNDGHGALRLWGQTGDRPTVWMAAADPVFLEARLDHLCLHSLLPQEFPRRDLVEIFDELQSDLGGEDGLGFVHIGRYGYLRGSHPMATATLSATALHGREPSPYMPTGGDANAYHRLHSEIQMALHLSDVHRRREAEGLRPINALWIWGGGEAPTSAPRSIPPLYADDALVRGYWHSAAGIAQPWGGLLSDCVEQSPQGFVAIVPHVLRPTADGMGALSEHLTELRAILRNSAIRSLKLLFRDGITVQVRRRHVLRIWRRRTGPLEPGGDL